MLRSFVIALAVAVPSTASAHLTVDFPQNRYGEEQKSEPCGRLNGLRTPNVSVFAPGETITISLRETINHPSHFRVSFDDDGHDDFCYPASTTDFNTCASVMLDNIADDPAAAQTIEFTFPDVECENCTLQVVQVMYDKVATGWGDNDLYFNCADIALRAPGATPDAGPDDPDAGVVVGGPDSAPGGNVDVDGGGCAAAPGSSSRGGAVLALLALALAWRRRKVRA